MFGKSVRIQTTTFLVCSFSNPLVFVEYDHQSLLSLVLRPLNLQNKQLREFGNPANRFNWATPSQNLDRAAKEKYRRECVGAIFNLSRCRAFGHVNAKGNPNIYRKSLDWNALIGLTPAQINSLNPANNAVHMDIKKISISSNGHEIRYKIKYRGPVNIPLFHSNRPRNVGYTIPTNPPIPNVAGQPNVPQSVKGSLNFLSRYSVFITPENQYLISLLQMFKSLAWI